MAKDPVANQAIRTLKEYAPPSIEGTVSSIRRLAIQANNFEIKLATIQMIQQYVQFCGLPSDDLNAHITHFLEICDTFQYNGVFDDVVRLRLFPFSLRDKAKSWLSSLPVGSITTWNMMAQKFLNLDDLLKKFIASKESRFQSQEVATKCLEATVQNQGSSIWNLEVQVGQLANVVFGRAQGALPSNTEKNPKEQVEAITLRSGRQIGEEESSDNEGEKEKVPKEAKKFQVSSKESEEVKSYVPPIPFPHGLKQHKLDKQFVKFLHIFKKLHINIPFADALAQMPSYAKFLKEILSNKRKLEEYETVKLTEEFLDMEEDHEVPLILGRPFLATGRTLIDVQQGKLMLMVENEQEDCPDLLEACVVHSKGITTENEDVKEYAFHLEACPPFLNSKESSIQDFRANMPWLKPFEEPPKLELKPLPEGIVLGHKVSQKGIEVDRAKVEVIEKFPPPSSVKAVRSFLGHEKLINAPVMVAPDWDLPFELMCDASHSVVGAVLG
ncbi:hypothetical protein SLEP1_g55742 [Rubroshorea leprosula]|uniref:Retrotransposon gag domain-containing protein n=1 Tax=Rubroshorea leprosula TaxID=152421 RepID=A0AAV5MG96_9ROSI|nr:hypothetical protein SLEP1_g55742 [Rubroshorea leprosula]